MKVDRRSNQLLCGLLALAGATAMCAACGGGAAMEGTGAGKKAADDSGGDRLRKPEETHLSGIVQLTRNQGENAEAYWSSSGRELIFQSSRPPHKCDQIFRVAADGSKPASLVSSGKGRTTCSYFFPGDERVLYSSTHLAGDACPPAPDHSQGYVWALYDSYDIFTAKPDGSDVARLTETPGYDAEATVCPRDGSIIFTSMRDGDLELYRMDKDGKNTKRLTSTPGYDGGAFFSPDCSRIVWRASRPEGKDLEDYKRLLSQGLVRPSKLEIFVANADGSDPVQVTYLAAASFAPYFHPSGTRILFSTNHPNPRGREFDIWAVNDDGSRLERITYAPGFDGFPMFSPDGKKLAFASNRGQAADGQTDLYVADWVEGKPQVTERSAADRLADDIAWLADDARQGRGVGTAGIDASADWLAAQMKQAGIEGGMEGGGYFQPIDVPVAVAVAEKSTLSIAGQAVPAGSFVPAGFSAQKAASGRTVAVGYGIASKEARRDDWKGKSVKGKIAVVRRFVPRGAFKKPDDQQRQGDPHRKAVEARKRGAIGLIVVDAPEEGGEEAPLPALQASDLAKEVGIPVVAVKREVGEKLLRGSAAVKMEIALDVTRKPTRNVVGVVRNKAKDAMPGALVVGAHYDHLGMGGEHSREPGTNAPHNGADDNASGTAAVLEIGRRLVANQSRLKRDVYLVGFTAEELGVVGSKHFAAHLPGGMKPSDVVGMINLDMVGRLRNNEVIAFGTDTAAEWKSLVTPACQAARIRCKLSEVGGLGPSDHTSFYNEKIPVLYLFTDTHEDYHKSTDDADRINAGGAAQIAAATADVALALSAMGGVLTYRAVPSSLPMGDRRSFNASLGTIPSYTNDKPGVLLDGVRPGGAADQAGLKKGDLIVKIGDAEIRSVQEMVYVLQDARPGQKAILTIERDGKKLRVEATFAKSTRGGPGGAPPAQAGPPKK
ncbi:MAG TPA: M20/M25/M40 family metallo-hydrolase [Kofleriaceae bacterium]|nr:M20/M25/M40 family metallo-hydrolase [Kofleriaceae bacterium]